VLTILIFCGYLFFFCWLVTRLRFFTNSGISRQWLIILFLIKVAAGVAYGFFYSRPQYIEGSDSFHLFSLSCKETDWLLQNPSAFLRDFFTSGYEEKSNLFISKNSFWNDLKDNTIIKLMAVVNVFTGKRYFVDIIFFNFLFFFGPVALFKLLNHLYPGKKLWLLCSVFLIPSYVFWCSGLHKDGLIFSSISLAVYCFYLMNEGKKLRVKYAAVLLLSMAALFLLRNFLLFLLLPSLVACFLSFRFPSKKWISFIIVYGVALLLFFLFPHIDIAFNFPQYLVGKQEEFRQLAGNSAIDVPAFNTSFLSICSFLPYALDIAFLRPHLNELKGVAYYPAALENLIIVLLMIAAFIKSRKQKASSLLLALLFFSGSVLLMTGYTVTFSAAVMRYKSIVLPLLASVFVVVIKNGSIKRNQV